MDTARIGPNAILQLIPLLDRALGPVGRRALFARAGVAEPAPDSGMLAQDQVIRLHRAVREDLPDLATSLARESGLATGDYILAHRIPGFARTLIRSLPHPLGARLLSAAIAKHAWTFAGSGVFAIERHRPLTVTIAANPLAVGPRCDWHAAVFERLFGALVWPKVQVVETACCGCGDPVCRFEIGPCNRVLIDSKM